MRRRQVLTLLGGTLLPRVAIARSALPAPHVFERGLMGTRFEIRCHHPDPEEARTAAAAAFDAAAAINDIASDYIADSELLQICRHPAGQPVSLSPALWTLVSQAFDFASKTGGCFDPTVGPLTRLWRESRRRKALPDPDTLATARAACGWQRVALDAALRTLTFQRPGMRLDLGGIAKGQAADAMLAVMEKHGIRRSCITAGGEVRLGEPPPGAEGWKIGVRTFRKDQQSEVLELSRCAVSTSGDLHQFIEIGGVRYSHIVDPATGLGLTRRVAATVIAPTAAASDAIDTACCVAAPANAKAMALSAGATTLHLSA